MDPYPRTKFTPLGEVVEAEKEKPQVPLTVKAEGQPFHYTYPGLREPYGSKDEWPMSPRHAKEIKADKFIQATDPYYVEAMSHD